MKFRHSDLEIPADNPFLNCKLDRKKYAHILTNVVENYPDGFVLAINNKWGTGKSTFVKMWKQYLVKKDFNTIYFNAWENDFEDNPLTAFIGELQIIKKREDDKFNSILKNAASITKNVAPALLKSVLKKYVDSDTLVDAFTDTSKSVIEIFEEDIKEYAQRKESITQFQKSLSEFVANNSNGKPLVFIVDELDRCRPNYAVLLLEQIKHFFSVPNIVFVLSIDKIQLGNAICGVYGSEKIDTDEYLRRFIDVEYSIPEPDKSQFITYLYDYYDFDSFLRAPKRNEYRDLQYDRDNFIDTCKLFLGGLTLRQQEKILSHTRLVLRTFNYNNYLIPYIFVFLAYLKALHPNFYQNMSRKSLTLNAIQDEFYKIVSHLITDDNKKLLVHIEAYLLKFYENFKTTPRRESELFERVENSREFKLKMDSKIDNDDFLTILTNGRISRDYLGLDISYLIDKLDLVNDLIIN